MTQSSLPGSKWLAWVGNPTRRVGLLTGVYLSTVMIVAVLAANRVPFLEAFADLRNWIFRFAFLAVALVPVLVFRRQPARMFASSVTGWFVFAVMYGVMGWFFENLHVRINQTPFHAFILGAAIYGVLAVALWVGEMVREARHQPAIASRRRP
jgi:cyanate permease